MGRGPRTDPSAYFRARALCVQVVVQLDAAVVPLQISKARAEASGHAQATDESSGHAQATETAFSFGTSYFIPISMTMTLSFAKARRAKHCSPF